LNNTSNAHRPLPLLPLSLSLSLKKTPTTYFLALYRKTGFSLHSLPVVFSLSHTHIEKRKENINQIKIKKNSLFSSLKWVSWA
jgi:hypothetical protein